MGVRPSYKENSKFQKSNGHILNYKKCNVQKNEIRFNSLHINLIFWMSCEYHKYSVIDLKIFYFLLVVTDYTVIYDTDTWRISMIYMCLIIYDWDDSLLCSVVDWLWTISTNEYIWMITCYVFMNLWIYLFKTTRTITVNGYLEVTSRLCLL